MCDRNLLRRALNALGIGSLLMYSGKLLTICVLACEGNYDDELITNKSCVVLGTGRQPTVVEDSEQPRANGSCASHHCHALPPRRTGNLQQPSLCPGI